MALRRASASIYEYVEREVNAEREGRLVDIYVERAVFYVPLNVRVQYRFRSREHRVHTDAQITLHRKPARCAHTCMKMYNITLLRVVHHYEYTTTVHL